MKTTPSFLYTISVQGDISAEHWTFLFLVFGLRLMFPSGKMFRQLRVRFKQFPSAFFAGMLSWRYDYNYRFLVIILINEG